MTKHKTRRKKTSFCVESLKIEFLFFKLWSLSVSVKRRNSSSLTFVLECVNERLLAKFKKKRDSDVIRFLLVYNL